MSYITWDYYCPTCRTTEERFVERAHQDAQFCNAADCGGKSVGGGTKMIRRTAAPPTTFSFADKSPTKKGRKT